MVQVYRTKKDTIYEILKEEIYNGNYEPGQKLVIRRLAKRFHTSEIPVREALHQLNAEGLIEIKPHVGAVVSCLSSKDIQNIFDLRIEMEALATRLATDHLDDKDFVELRAMIEDSKLVLTDKDYAKYTALNLDFHMKIYSKCDNELLIKTIQDLWRNSNRYPRIFYQNDDHVKKSIREHEEIYEALLQRDQVLAEQLMIQHKAQAAREILRLTQRDYYKV